MMGRPNRMVARKPTPTVAKRPEADIRCGAADPVTITVQPIIVAS